MTELHNVCQWGESKGSGWERTSRYKRTDCSRNPGEDGEWTLQSTLTGGKLFAIFWVFFFILNIWPVLNGFLQSNLRMKKRRKHSSHCFPLMYFYELTAFEATPLLGVVSKYMYFALVKIEVIKSFIFWDFFVAFLWLFFCLSRN